MQKNNKVPPKVWMNVTTSANWNRPPVGIVRVEQALADELEKLLGEDNFHRCVWMDGQFVKWIPSEVSSHNFDYNADKNLDDIIDNLIPKTSSFDLARKFLRFKFKKLQSSTKEKNTISTILPSQQKSTLGLFTPKPGDILISVGLDWDSPYIDEFYNLSKNKNLKIITCCYDLIPVLFPQYCVGDVADKFKDYFIKLSWGSEAVLCISEKTKSDYLRLCEDLAIPEKKTKVIPLGDNVPKNVGQVSDEVANIIDEPFILFVSTIERRKNHEVLYRAYHLLSEAGYKDILPKLIFVGMPGWGVGDLLKDIELDPLTKNLIIQLNHVSDADLSTLYKKSLFCVYPSLYEGWGLPVGEALAQGKVVIASDQGSLPEVGGDLVKYVSPWDAYAWADTLLEFIQNRSLIKSMEDRIKKEYKPRNWKDTAKVVNDLINEIINQEVQPMILYPGYDMSTQCGMHFGPEIRSCGKSGFLVYGPHRGIVPGNYEVKILYSNLSDIESNLKIEFACNQGKNILCELVEKVYDTSELKEIIFNLNVQEFYDDYEIRILVAESIISVSKIIISPLTNK